MSETIESISQWADETFGPATPFSSLNRALDEIGELRKLWHRYPDVSHEELVNEAADVCITLYRYIHLVDKDTIEKKMTINRARKWKVNGDGTGHHVKSKEELGAECMEKLYQERG